MARWLVKLEGERFDVEEFPYWFPDGDVYAVEIEGEAYLVGPLFERLSDSTEVHDAALQALDEFFAIVSLLDPTIARPRLGAVAHEHDDGHREWSASICGSATLRAKVRGRISVSDEADGAQRPTQAQTLLSGLGVYAHLDTAVSLWADPTRTWPRLYRIME